MIQQQLHEAWIPAAGGEMKGRVAVPILDVGVCIRLGFLIGPSSLSMRTKTLSNGWFSNISNIFYMLLFHCPCYHVWLPNGYILYYVVLPGPSAKHAWFQCSPLLHLCAAVKLDGWAKIHSSQSNDQISNLHSLTSSIFLQPIIISGYNGCPNTQHFLGMLHRSQEGEELAIIQGSFWG